jgi:hypothetical protein
VVKNGMKTLKQFEQELNRISKWINKGMAELVDAPC